MMLPAACISLVPQPAALAFLVIRHGATEQLQVRAADGALRVQAVWRKPGGIIFIGDGAARISGHLPEKVLFLMIA